MHLSRGEGICFWSRPYFSLKVEGASGGLLIQPAGVCLVQVRKQAPKRIGRSGGTP